MKKIYLFLSASALIYGISTNVTLAADDSISKSTPTAGKTAVETNTNKNITFTDPQKTIVVKKTEPKFAVLLQSNPTTGFSWSLKSYNADLIRAISRTFYPSKTGLIGAGGYEKWVFAVRPAAFVVPQTTSITLIYARPWDLEGAQASNFKVITLNDN